MWKKTELNDDYDLSIRPAERLRGAWEACGDIVARDSGKSLARLYGAGATGTAAEAEVHAEAERWLRGNTASKMRSGAA